LEPSREVGRFTGPEIHPATFSSYRCYSQPERERRVTMNNREKELFISKIMPIVLYFDFIGVIERELNS
jgi:hypothetical protein